MSTNQYTIDPNSHPADAAMLRENSPPPAGSSLTPQELAHYSQMNPADLVSQLANGDVRVPADSPLRKMSSDQLRAEMTKGMKAISDLRASQQSINRLESRAANSNDVAGLIGIPAFDSQGNAILDATGSEFQKAEQAIDQSRRSARRAGLGDFEFDEAMRQLAVSAPNAPATATPSGAPYEITKGPDGSYDVLIDTGEHFKGANADEIIQKLTHSKRKTGLWGRDLNAQLKQLQNGQTPSAATGQPQQATQPSTERSRLETGSNGQQRPESESNWQQLGTLPDESSKFLVENAAKVLGYNSADELINHQLERDQKLSSIEQKLEQYEVNATIQDFISENPDYPDTHQAADAIDKIISASGLEWNAENMGLAHQHAIRKGFYQPLRPEGVEATYQPREHGRRVPPRPPQGNAPGGDENLNPWAMGKDELRRKVLEGGGLGKALMDMKPGETFGI